ncbi:MAG TPA: hypothetical protein VJM31_04535 [Vicinamibacterales bacterium]|nr:hypothetical protein [Vicinamibacterales bacterium]
MKKTRVLRLVRERKFAELLDPPARGAVFEASGVFAIGGACFVVFDNIRRAARVASHLRLDSPEHRWLGSGRAGEGYEAITYDPARRRFYLMIEAEKHPDGTFKAVIEECDERWRFKARAWVDVPFEDRNTGFEGLASVKAGGRHYLLALCEGNRCRGSRKKRGNGRGRIHVLEKRGRTWQPVACIKLPPHVNFRDYAGLALRGDSLAVVSQESSRLWVGRLRRGRWAIVGRGRIYDFPRTKKKGKRLYGTVEGISWLSPTSLVAVSDLRKKRHPKRCERNDQSIHIFKTV